MNLILLFLILLTLPVLFGLDSSLTITASAPDIANSRSQPQTGELDPDVTYNDIIPPVNYTAKGHEELGLQYLPVSAALKCIFYFNQPRNETALSYGQYVAAWFTLQGTETDDYIIFKHEFPWAQYNLSKGWKSALTQARVAECFMKAYEHTHYERYFTLAKKSLNFLRVPVSEGGVLIDEGSNKWWYEEYPSKGGSYVLNGHQFVLIALSKYLEIIDDPVISESFNNGLNALKADAMKYDNGFNNSFYDRLDHPALKYHKTHIINFQRLYDITGDEEWLEIKKDFEN